MMSSVLRVAVGIVRNSKNEVLISKRHIEAHQGGLWEFPGGKFEASEDTFKALKRELDEELGIQIYSASPLIKVQHQYTKLTVLLDVQIVESYSGVAIGKESQELRWVALEELNGYSFLAANQAIINTLLLPKFYPIVDDSMGECAEMEEHLNFLIEQGYKAIQLRAKNLSANSFNELAKNCIQLSNPKGVTLFLNTSMNTAMSLGATAVHLTAERLMAMGNQMPKTPLQIAASCHSEKELHKAEKIGAKFAVLSPVCKTESHSGVRELGWAKFREYAEYSKIPVFALGGLARSDLSAVLSSNGQGVAGIRDFIPRK
ncbi:MAG: hypothetical protein A6F71_02945 [Cycloclasticus sp. symbiont of Poecilosclerida sp. M]|nr:MAG: hypothetical protein A6F71_02945 [Cycloclasticus sp. symbiont of Poecilosclerida sp. M]